MENQVASGLYVAWSHFSEPDDVSSWKPTSTSTIPQLLFSYRSLAYVDQVGLRHWTARDA
jgi:hypothetical protein